MNILLLKSILALPLVIMALIAMYTMFEVFGRKEKRYSIAGLKTVHRWNGYLFLLLFLVIAYLCIDLLARSRMPLDVRAMFHVVFALAVFLLLLIKISFVRIYRLFYSQATGLGMAIAVLAMIITAITSGYYLLLTLSGTPSESAMDSETAGEPPAAERIPDTGPETGQPSAERGRLIYRKHCISCHDPESREPVAGRGQKDILRRELLPVSGRPATPENIERQLREPIGTMPAFDWMDRRQIEDLIAYLKTL